VLDVLVREGRLHIVGGDVVLAELVWIEHEAHRIAALAEDAHAGHAGVVCTLSRIILSAMSLSDWVSRGSLRSVRKMIGEASASASERSEPRLSSTRIELCPVREVRESTRIPATPLIARSSGSVMTESITSGLAPA